MSEETYIARVMRVLNEECPIKDQELLRFYALLVLTTGEGTTLEHVHDAWALWQLNLRPGHRSLIPFADMAKAIQVKDIPYAEAIRRAARRLKEED